MKKIVVGFALGITCLSFAQQYPRGGWGDNEYYQDDHGYYSDQDDRSYFPDDYYYNYPQDYYPSNYYQSTYDDYRNSVVNVNWDVFFTQNRLSPWQIDQIQRLNNLYISFSAWNNFYKYNPDRWYYDRFYALERIMGPRVFVVFQNNYYQGYSSPVVYFQHYRRTHYIPICRPMPRYRNVDVGRYRVDRVRFHRMNNPTFNIVRRDRGSMNYSGGFRNDPNSRSYNNSEGRRNDRVVRGNGGFRNNTSNRVGFRNPEGGSSGGFRRENRNAGGEPMKSNTNGFRDNNTGSGFRRNVENTGSRDRNRIDSNENNGGFRRFINK